MSVSAMPAELRALSWAEKLGCYVELSKPRIGFLVLLTVAVSMLVASAVRLDLAMFALTLTGVGLVAASSSAVNHWLECRRDALMPRTAQRPLPSGRLQTWQALTFAAATLLVGLALLISGPGLAAAATGLVAWVLYAWVYTPLKAVTSMNTTVGAVAGAFPVIIGWVATGAAWDLRLAMLFAVVFLWQYPHFMAIAWLYRSQYGRAGMQMATVVDPTGRQAGWQAVGAAALLVIVSAAPAILAPGLILYGLLALGLGVCQLVFACYFLTRMNDVWARRLLRCTLIYLPALMAAIVCTIPWV